MGPLQNCLRKKNFVLLYFNARWAGRLVWLWSCGHASDHLRLVWFALVRLLGCRHRCFSFFSHSDTYRETQKNRTPRSRARRSDRLLNFLVSLESICKWLPPRGSSFWRKLLVWEKNRKKLIFSTSKKCVRKTIFFSCIFQGDLVGTSYGRTPAGNH